MPDDKDHQEAIHVSTEESVSDDNVKKSNQSNPHPNNANCSSCKCRVFQRDFWIAAAPIVTAVATFFIMCTTTAYTIFAYRQWKTMSGQLDVLGDQLDAAVEANKITKSSLDIAITSMHLAHRPQIVRESIKDVHLFDNGIEFRVVLRNTGRGAAINLTKKIATTLEEATAARSIPELFPGVWAVKNAASVVVGENQPYEIPDRLVWSSPERVNKLIEVQKFEIFVRVRVRYDDLFGNGFWMNSCDLYIPRWKRFIECKEGSTSGSETKPEK